MANTRSSYDAQTGEHTREVMDFDAGTYTRTVDGVEVESRALTDDERNSDDERNEEVDPNVDAWRVHRLETLVLRLLDRLVANDAITAGEAQQIKDAAQASTEHKRPRV